MDRRVPHAEVKAHGVRKTIGGLGGGGDEQQSATEQFQEATTKDTGGAESSAKRARSRTTVSADEKTEIESAPVAEEEQGLKPKTKAIPTAPSQSEIDLHELNHIPPRSWCRACVGGKRADDPHRTTHSDDTGLPVVGWDHADIALIGGRDDLKVSFKAVVDYRSGGVASICISKEVTEPLIKFVMEALEDWGHKDLVVRCQQEVSEMKLQSEILSRRLEFQIIPQQSKRYSHGSLGPVEHAIKELEKQIRTLHIQLAIDCGCTQEQLSPNGDFMTWLVREAGWDLTHYQKNAERIPRHSGEDFGSGMVQDPRETSYRQVGR